MSRAVLSRLLSGLRAWTPQELVDPLIQSRGLSTTRRRFDGKGDKSDTELEDPPAAKLVVVERGEDFKIMSIGINRPEKRNCVNVATAMSLYEAFYQFEHDDEMHVAVLHGIGGNFCAGYDLEELASIDKDNIANTIVSFKLVFRT
jgi:hypothetical protein